MLGFWDNGFRHLSSSARPIRRPEDCHGLKIRTQMSELHGESFRALGFEPVAVDIKEFTESIVSGTCQAQDNPLPNIYNFDVHKYHPFITLTGHFYGASLLICNEQRYQGWPAEMRAAVDAAAREATVYQRELATVEDAEMLAKFAATGTQITQLTDAERGAFIAALSPVLERHRKEFDPALFAALGKG